MVSEILNYVTDHVKCTDLQKYTLKLFLFSAILLKAHKILLVLHTIYFSTFVLVLHRQLFTMFEFMSWST